jgi:hypothetical protein
MLTATSSEDEYPRIAKSLIDRLDSVCPEKCPTPEMSNEEIHHYAGKRAMVNFLIEIHNDQANIEK